MLAWGYVIVPDSTAASTPGICFVVPSVTGEMTQLPLDGTVAGGHPYMGSVVVVQMVVVPELGVHVDVGMDVAVGGRMAVAVGDMVVVVEIVVE